MYSHSSASPAFCISKRYCFIRPLKILGFVAVCRPFVFSAIMCVYNRGPLKNVDVLYGIQLYLVYQSEVWSDSISLSIDGAWGDIVCRTDSGILDRQLLILFKKISKSNSKIGKLEIEIGKSG